MRVAYIMSRFPALTQTFVLYEILALERMGVTVEVYPLLREKQRVKHAEADAVARRAHYHPFLSFRVLHANWHFFRRRPGVYLRTLLEVLRGTWGSVNFMIGAVGVFPKAVRFAYEMAAQGVSHIHAHFANHPTVAALIIHRLTGISYSFTGHGHDLHIDRRMLRHKIECAAFAVTISEYNRQLMIDECGGEFGDRVHVIHCGADTAFFGSVETMLARPLAILAVGSLLEVKGHTYLIEACRLLQQKGIEFSCQIVGEGKERRKLELQIRSARLEHKVTLCGARTRQAIARLMANSDVIVQPSVHTRRGSREGIPVALMEGMASGLPVVASRLSGIPELVQDGESGLLVPQRDPLSLAEALHTLSEQPLLRRQMGRQGRARVLREFDVHANAAHLAKLFIKHEKHPESERRQSVAVANSVEATA